LHTLFHVTTTGSLVAGLYDGAVSVADMERHGNFGLGMFSGLDDEMVVLDGSAYHVKGDGTVKAAGVGAAATFAVVTFFQGASMVETGSIASFEALKAYCDGIRPSDNLIFTARSSACGFRSPRRRSPSRDITFFSYLVTVPRAELSCIATVWM
jgi:acetolactate decarboxylase